MRCVFSKNLLEILSSASLHASFTSHSAKRAVYSINFVIWLRLIWTLRPLLTLPVCFPSSSSPHSQHILQSLLQSTIHNPVQETVFSLRPGKNWIVLRLWRAKKWTENFLLDSSLVIFIALKFVVPLHLYNYIEMSSTKISLKRS